MYPTMALKSDIERIAKAKRKKINGWLGIREDYYDTPSARWCAPYVMYMAYTVTTADIKGRWICEQD